ncbi:hypothetical protein RN001_015413 [Aquatica leii]|uniref:Luciferin 4-monooxygenase-like n=1 Tax=Aquatica leii TaxID=1421715 RepID=A0AAN7NZ53_9COLE|nr:hypothetical protein RN001_015413 [Aquatica leii]
MKNVIEVPVLDYNLDPRGAGHFFYNHMDKHKNNIAQVEVKTGNIDTYGDLLKRCVRASVYLKKIGLQPGDFISVCTYNHLNACVPMIAAFFINAIMSALDPTLSLEDMVHLLQQIKPKVVFTTPESVTMIESVIKRIGTDTAVIVFGSTSSHVSFSDALATCTKNEILNFSPTSVRTLDDIGIVYFSSGTTGLAKTLCHTHYSIICQSTNNAESGFNFGLTFGYYSPYWTVYSQCLCTSIIMGTARLLLPKFDKSNPWEPFYHKPKVDVSFVKDIFIAGGVIDSDQVKNLQNLFVDSEIYRLYGQSEVLGYLAHFTPKDKELKALKPDSVGLGIPGVSYKIVDVDSRLALGPHKRGELCVKTKFAMTGYYNMDSSDTWDTDGWLRTGDIGYYDEDNCFYIVDRIKEMFKYQGWHVTPSSIENVLLQHPAVGLAVALGVPHKIDGHHPMGVVVLKHEHSNTTANEILKFADAKLEDRLKLRAGLKIVQTLPLTGSGKIHRRKLKESLGL